MGDGARFNEVSTGRSLCKQLVLPCVLGCWFVLAGKFAMASFPAQANEPIRTAAAAHGLSPSEAAQGRPVVLQANVTFYAPPDGPWGEMLFVSDPSGGVFVRLAKPLTQPLREGMPVHVTGVSAPGDFTSIVNAARVDVLSGGPEPAPPSRMTRQDLVTGGFDCWPVEVQGLVHSIRIDGKSASLRIWTDEGVMAALLVREPGVDYGQFLDATVVLHGVAAPDFNPHRQMTGFHLFVPGVNAISIQARGGGDPFASEVRPIGQLARFDPGVSALNRLHFRGRATLDWPGRLVCLEDDSGGLCVASDSPEKIAVGSAVDVAGYPVFAVAIPGIEDALVRARGVPAGALVAPRTASVAKVLQGEFSGELLSMRGQLVGVSSDAQSWRLALTQDGVVYTALMPREGDRAMPSTWLEGSYLRVVGVCEQEEDASNVTNRVWVSDQRFKSFRILMRTEADVEILRRPSWWTPAHTFLALSCALAVTLAVFGWVVMLRRQVDQRTEQLRESESRFKHLARHDPLTGLPNRAWFQERAELALDLARRNAGCVGLLLIDLDHFKPVNDTLGHDAGDAMLCELAKRVTGVVRRVDTVARLGGDEFAVVLMDVTSGEDAERVATKVLAAICRPLTIQGNLVPMSGSIGVAVFPGDGENPTELLRSADQAMYESKKLARGGARRYKAEASREQVETKIPRTEMETVTGEDVASVTR
jgi:diguanylate cyclase (GGDEF)-like protein